MWVTSRRVVAVWTEPCTPGAHSIASSWIGKRALGSQCRQQGEFEHRKCTRLVGPLTMVRTRPEPCDRALKSLSLDARSLTLLFLLCPASLVSWVPRRSFPGLMWTGCLPNGNSCAANTSLTTPAACGPSTLSCTSTEHNHQRHDSTWAPKSWCTGERRIVCSC